MSSQSLHKKWLCVGDIGWDIYQNQSDEKRFPGGITLNHLIHLSNLGHQDLSFLGPLSQSEEDSHLLETLKERKVKVISPHREIGHAPKQFIRIEEGGEKNFLNYEAGILENYQYSKPNGFFDYILLPIFSQNWSWAQELLKNPPDGKLVCDFLDGKDFNQNLEFLMDHKSSIDLLVVGCPSEDDQFYQTLADSTGQWSRRLLVTRGHMEGFYYDGGDTFYFRPEVLPEEKVIDTTGAGDAFLTSFLSSHSMGLKPNESLAKACAFASKQIQKVGPN